MADNSQNLVSFSLAILKTAKIACSSVMLFSINLFSKITSGEKKTVGLIKFKMLN